MIKLNYGGDNFAVSEDDPISEILKTTCKYFEVCIYLEDPIYIRLGDQVAPIDFWCNAEFEGPYGDAEALHDEIEALKRTLEEMYNES
jgi:hypothetical protein